MARSDAAAPARHHRRPRAPTPRPAIAADPGFADAGGLLTYTLDPGETARRAAIAVDRVLRGGGEGRLPAAESEPAVRFTLNLRIAEELGLDVPTPVVLRADRAVR